MTALTLTLAAIVAHPLVMRFLAARAHPSRLRMAAIGRALVHAPDLCRSLTRP